MSENLTGRVGRIISGSLNALVDVIENASPEAVMEQAIREIDSAVDDVRIELGRVVANKHLANKRLMDENRKHEDLAEKIEIALNEGRDDLAEVAISQQLDIEVQIPILDATISEGASQEKELEGYISALQAKKREMKSELQQFREVQKDSVVAQSGADSSVAVTSGGSNVQSRVDKAGSAFDRVLEKATGVASGTQPSDQSAASKLAELEDLARKNRVQERLAAIKGKTEK